MGRMYVHVCIHVCACVYVCMRVHIHVCTAMHMRMPEDFITMIYMTVSVRSLYLPNV